MKAAVAALALALSATIAMAQDSGQLTPEQQKARDYFKPGGQLEKDNPGIRQRLHDEGIKRRAQEEMRRGAGGDILTREGRCLPSDPNS